MTSEITRLRTSNRMSQVVVANGVIHLSGQVADSAGASIRTQTTEILDRIDVLLSSANSDKTRLLTASVWLSVPTFFDEFNALWDSWLLPGHAPTRCCVVAQLMKSGLDVEIAVTALVSE